MKLLEIEILSKEGEEKMIHFEGIEHCSCEISFEWAIIKLEKNECVFGEVDKLNKNVCGMIEIPNGYGITLKCPNCCKKIFVVRDQ